MALSPGFRIDAYEIVSLLETGGIGEVYETLREAAGTRVQRATAQLGLA